jgi:hypothetical protein
MGLFLKIENKGVADYNSLLLFGATGNRYSTNPMTIGTFGSGGKHSVGALLRANTNVQIFCGLTKLSYFSKPKKLRKASGGENMQQQVCCIIGGSLPPGAPEDERMGTKELSFTLDFGSHDWPMSTGVELACREFVSNAIDGQLEMTGDFDGVVVEVVDESKVRAKDGFTRVFLPLTEKVQKFYNELGKWFLHFSEPDVVRKHTKVLPKANRNRTDVNRAVVYRRGVYVREFMASNLASLFDYNLDVQLNEARTFDDWSAKREVAVALRNADRSVIARILMAIQKGEQAWELTLDEYGLVPASWETEDVAVVETRKGEWQAAAQLVIGDNGVFCDDVKCVGEMVEKKGFNPVRVENKAWLNALKLNGVRTDEHILTQDDKAGRVFSEPNDVTILALDIVWKAMESLGMTSGKSKPACGRFQEPIDCEARAAGLYRPEMKTVYLNVEYAENLDYKAVYVMVEEVIHHISGATDFSRDFQTLLVQIIGRMFYDNYQTAQKAD